MNTPNSTRYLLLYIPFLLALLLQNQTHASYLVAWLGSFFIFYLSYSGLIKPLAKDLKVFDQLMRPIFLMQIIFGSYMACTSIFYYINALGYQYFDYTGNTSFFMGDIFQSIAQCQKYYVLGHAALVHGILYGMKYPVEVKYKLYAQSMSNLLLGISIFCLPVGYIFGHIGALSQFSIQLGGLSFVSGTIALAFSIREKKKTTFYFALILFISNFLNSLVSGFKEPIIICTMLLGIFLLPIYGRKVFPIFGTALVFLFFVLPSFIGTYRKLKNEGVDAVEARDKSIDAIVQSNQESLQKTNWEFLVYRISEIDMFMKFTSSTPSYVPYYNTKIINNAVVSVIPRFFWSGKPNIENMVMDRVYRAGVIDETSLVSAKPAYIVDCYLSYGTIGVWLGLFLYGFTAQWISIKAEKLFGGYFMGCAVMFSGLFQIFWRGNSFEFILSSVFWSCFTMYLFFLFLRNRGYLERIF